MADLMAGIGEGLAAYTLAQERRRREELEKQRIAEARQFELEKAGYQQMTDQGEEYSPAPSGNVVWAGGKAYRPPEPKLSPLTSEGKTVPGRYIFQLGNQAQLVNLPKQYTGWEPKTYDLGEGQQVTVGFPKTEQGIDYGKGVVLQKPEKMDANEVIQMLKLRGLLSLSPSEQKQALFPGLKPRQMRQLDVYAKSVGIDPQKMRDGTITQDEANKLVNKIIEVGDKSVLSQLLRGSFGNLIGGSLTQPGRVSPEAREFELLTKKRDGTLTSQEQEELNRLQGR
jgi:hypothetical protein